MHTMNGIERRLRNTNQISKQLWKQIRHCHCGRFIHFISFVCRFRSTHSTIVDGWGWMSHDCSGQTSRCSASARAGLVTRMELTIQRGDSADRVTPAKHQSSIHCTCSIQLREEWEGNLPMGGCWDTENESPNNWEMLLNNGVGRADQWECSTATQQPITTLFYF